MTWANITFVLLLIQKPIAILGICLFAGWMPVNKAYTLIAGLLIMSFVVSMSTHLTRWVDLYGLIGWLILSKVCAFLGNDYDFMSGRSRLRRPNEPLKEKIKEQIDKMVKM